MASERTCIGCRTTRPAADLVRYTLDDRGIIQCGRQLPGRGAWLCPDISCLEAAVARSAFDRAFRTAVRPSVAKALLTATESQTGATEYTIGRPRDETSQFSSGP